jgi:hypothetical protein
VTGSNVTSHLSSASVRLPTKNSPLFCAFKNARSALTASPTGTYSLRWK